MLRETQSQRIRDTRREVDRWLAGRMEARSGGKTEGRPVPPPIVLSETEVAQLLGCDRDTVRSQLRRQVPGIKAGKCWRYQVRDVVSWMVQKEMEAGS